MVLFLVGFFGIHSILIKNLVLYPVLGNNDIITIFGFKVEISDLLMNMIDMCWGALIWSSGKRVLLP